MSKCIHLAPRYHGYKHGDYANITRCSYCGKTALYQDQHPSDPCSSCGSRICEIGSGKWIPEKRGGFLGLGKIVKHGEWIVPQRG